MNYQSGAYEAYLLGVSKHIIVKPKTVLEGKYVDATGIDGRNMLLPGEIPDDPPVGGYQGSQQRP